MARAHANYVHGGSYDYDADYSQDEKDDHCDGMIAALTATGLTEAQLEVLANGTHYIIERPRFDEGPRHASDDSRFGEPSNDEVRRAMLAAKEGCGHD